MLALDVRCTTCRYGLVCCEMWEAWYARRGELEAEWLATHDSLDAFEQSPQGRELLEAQPDCETEVECTECQGTGVSHTEEAHPAA